MNLNTLSTLTSLAVSCPQAHYAQPNTLEFEFALGWRRLQDAESVEVTRLAAVHATRRAALLAAQRARWALETLKLSVSARPHVAAPLLQACTDNPSCASARRCLTYRFRPAKTSPYLPATAATRSAAQVGLRTCRPGIPWYVV